MDDREVERLKELAGRLSGLMADPEPGLWTWNAMVAEVLAGLAPAAGPPTDEALKKALAEWLATKATWGELVEAAKLVNAVFDVRRHEVLNQEDVPSPDAG